jgi:predicted nucleic acid-binding protein
MFATMAESDVFLSVLTIGELRKGIDRLKPGPKKHALSTWIDRLAVAAEGRILSVDLETAVIWGEVSARAEKKGRPIPAIDGLLAATALRHGLHLMTRNVADFEPTGVLLVNPWEDGDG